MAINTNASQIGVLLESIFGVASSNNTHGINKLQFCHGDFPASTSTTISATDTLTAGTAPNNFTIFNGTNWSVPSEGVTILASAISGLIKSTGLPAGAAISFVRLFSNSSSVPIFDIPVDIAKGADNAVLSKISGIVANEQIALKDIRMKIVTKGDFSFNNALASAILRHIVGNANTLIGYYGALMFGQGYVYDTGAGTIASPLIMDIYDGTIIPESANMEPTGTLLWRKQISDGSGAQPNIFSISGTSVTLSSSQSANAIATGTPKYLRVYKNGVTTPGGLNYPKLVLQIPIGNGVGFASIDRTTVTSGQSVSLNDVSFIIQP